MKCASFRKKAAGGFALLEIIIGTGIMGAAMATTAIMMHEQQIKDDARGQAEGLATFQQVAAQYFITYRGPMTTAMTDGTDANKHCVIGATGLNTTTGALTGGTVANSTTLHTCAFDALALNQKGLWPLAVPSATKDRPVAIFKRVYKPGPDNTMGTGDDVATDQAEMLVMTMSASGSLTPPASWSRDRDAGIHARELAKTMGSTGGYMPVGDVGICRATKNGETEVCGHGWKLNLGDFIDSAQLSTVKNSLPN